MFDLTIHQKEIKWLQLNYPKLALHNKVGGCPIIEGFLQFDMIFSDAKGRYIINPQDEFLEQGIRIQDEYSIKIIFESSEFSDLPKVYEVGGRLKRVASISNSKLEDLHVNRNYESCCLCIKPEEDDRLPDGFNIVDFFNNLLIPFFYAQSFFEKQSQWPWGEYSHGAWGLIEWHLLKQEPSARDIEELLIRIQKHKDQWPKIREILLRKNQIKGHQECICGLAYMIKSCHPKVFQGIWKLRKDIRRFGIKTFEDGAAGGGLRGRNDELSEN